MQHSQNLKNDFFYFNRMAKPSMGALFFSWCILAYPRLVKNKVGAELTEREGSRVEVFLFNEIRIIHHPHPRPDTDKGAAANIREWLKNNEVEP